MADPTVIFYHTVVSLEADSYFARKHPTVEQFAAHRIHGHRPPRAVPRLEGVEDDAILEIPQACAMENPDEHHPRCGDSLRQRDVDAGGVEMVVVRAHATDET